MITTFKFKSLPALLDHFKDESTCIEFLTVQRWGVDVACPHCGALKPYTTNRGYKCSDNACYKKFTVRVGTMFESSKIGLRIWFAAIFLMTAHKKGISSCQMARDLDISQKTAWFLNHRIREMMSERAPHKLSGTIEVDETFIGAKDGNKNQSAYGKEQRKRSRLAGTYTPTPKAVLLGMLQRDGKIVVRHVKDTQKISLYPVMLKNIEEASTIYTDQYEGYTNLRNHFGSHKAISHKNGEYVRGNVHTNGLEGAWGLMKRGIIGIYHQVSPKHLQRYANEFTFRYNERQILDCQRFTLTVSQCEGRLKWKDLIKND